MGIALIDIWLNSIQNIYHDAFFFRIANLMGRLYILPEKTYGWRRHSNNVSNKGKYHPYTYLVSSKYSQADILKRNIRFINDKDIAVSRFKKVILCKKARLYEKRAYFYSKPIFLNWCKMIPYFLYFENLGGLFWDFQFLFRKARERGSR